MRNAAAAKFLCVFALTALPVGHVALANQVRTPAPTTGLAESVLSLMSPYGEPSACMAVVKDYRYAYDRGYIDHTPADEATLRDATSIFRQVVSIRINEEVKVGHPRIEVEKRYREEENRNRYSVNRFKEMEINSLRFPKPLEQMRLWLGPREDVGADMRRTYRRCLVYIDRARGQR